MRGDAAQDAPEPPPGAAPARFKLAVRVSSQRADGRVVIDRGARDRVAVGDLVSFQPRGGMEVTGLVRDVQEQRAEVELHGARPGDAPTLASGTRGVALISRAADAPAPRAAVAPPAPLAGAGPTSAAPALREGPLERQPDAAATDAERWRALDDEWTSDMPLLAAVGTQRPEARPRRMTGRAWTSFDAIFGASGERSDSFFRAGMDLALENPFGRGGELAFDGELVGRRADLPEDANGGEEDDRYLRVDRLYYGVGGTRFAPDRWTFGRFVSRELPDVGVQDGLEWSRRTDEGHRFGVSAAFLPEPDGRLDGTSDLGFSGWYRWVADEREETMLTAAFQQTFHDGANDRQRAILKAHHLPSDGWTLLGSAWLDLHDAEGLEGGPQVTEAHASAGRRYEDSHDVRVVYDHREYPDLATDEARSIGVESISDGKLDRLGLAGSVRLAGDRRLFGRAGAWADERDGGGDFELELELPLAQLDGARVRVGSFVAQGKYSALRGGRLSLGRARERWGWQLVYEVQLDSFEGFETINDDAVQHRFRASSELFGRSGWTLSVHAELQLQDIEDVYLAGFHFGRSF
ncbi:MAG: hypothetical protein R3F49_16145 [Planctomycetota bacterium]